MSPSRGAQSQTVGAVRRIISYSAEVHRRYQNTHTSLDVMLEDHWNVDEDRELSDVWTGFTRFIFIE